jgi:hypothetical protein
VDENRLKSIRSDQHTRETGSHKSCVDALLTWDQGADRPPDASAAAKALMTPTALLPMGHRGLRHS